MDFPTIPVRPVKKRSITRFRGLNRNPRPAAGEFSDMENLSPDGYPALTSRKKRGIYRRPASPQGLIARDQLCYVDGADFVLGDLRISMELSVDPGDCPKRLQSMGAYVIILPDKKYINTQNPGDFGDIEVSRTLENVAVTAGEQGISLRAEGIGAGFAAGDTVALSGSPETQLTGSFLLLEAAAGELVLEGTWEGETPLDTPLTLERKMPRLDYITESGNRLWGCRYALDDSGNPVNEIYACKLGDFKNWQSFQGLSTDSYCASCGTPGPFTGAAAHLGYPVFFKEACLHKVYGSEPSSFRIQTTPCRGVQPGCGESLALVGDRLIYRARDGICAYDGATAALISQKLGRDGCSRAVAGSLGDKYYISQCREGTWELLVWDSSRSYWYREDSLACSALCALGNDLFAIDGKSRNILSLTGTGEPEEEVCWMAQTGELGLESPEQKYISRLILSLTLEHGAWLEVLAQYDGEADWESLCRIFPGDLRFVRLPLRPRRCGYLRLRLKGNQGARVYGITRITEEGSDQT